MKNKKITSTLAVMSLFMLTPSMSQAEEMVEIEVVEKKTSSKKPSKKNENAKKGHNQYRMHKESGKAHMHEIEKELQTIIKDFKVDGDVQAAQEKLDAIPAKIKASVKEMQKNEVHGSMWKRHKNKMHAKLQEAQNIIDGKQNA